MSRKLNTSGQMILTAVLALAVIFPDWIFNAGALPSLLPAAHADSMTDAAGQGTDFANTLSGNVKTETSSWTTSMMPSTCANATAPQSSAFPTSCVPQLQPDQRSTYEANYANPGAMGGAKDPTGIVSQCYSNPGSPACQSRNNTAIGEINGVARDIIENAYPDCTKTITTTSPTQQFRTCTGTDTMSDVPCIIRTMFTTDAETASQPCSSSSIAYKPNQIYAICKDYQQYYRIPMGTHHAYGCGGGDCYCAPAGFYDPGQDGVGGCPGSGGATLPLYPRYCSSIPSDPNYAGLILPTLTDDYVDVTSQPEGSIFVSYKMENVNKLSHCSGNDFYVFDLFQLFVKYDHSEIERIYIAQDSTCGRSLNDPDCGIKQLDLCDLTGNNCVTVIDNGSQTNNTRSSNTCSTVVHGMENNDICVTSDFNFTVSYPTATPPPPTTVVDVTKNETVYLDQANNVINYSRSIGGPDAPVGLAAAYANVTFACNNKSNNCSSLVQQGCNLYSQQYTDAAQTQIEYTYRCGSGSSETISNSYTCNGQVRCMGTDCVSDQYTANQDFAQAAAGLAVLEEVRKDFDPSAMSIFGGIASSCQNSPQNCCRPNTGGMSITEYIALGHALYTGYTLITAGYSGLVAGYSTAIASFTGGLSTGVGSVTAAVGSQTILAGSYNFAAGATGHSAAFVTGLNPSLALDQGLSTTVTEAAALAPTEGASATATVSTMTPTLEILGSIASVVAIAVAVYAIVSTVYNLMFGCQPMDMVTSSKLGFHLCHQAGTCKKRVFGLSHNRVYCCYNSILARTIEEQGRLQLGKSWGTFEDGGDCDTVLSHVDCSGFTPGEVANLDFSQMDLSEYMQYMEQITPTHVDNAALADAFKNKFNSMSGTAPSTFVSPGQTRD